MAALFAECYDELHDCAVRCTRRETGRTVEPSQVNCVGDEAGPCEGTAGGFSSRMFWGLRYTTVLAKLHFLRPLVVLCLLEYPDQFGRSGVRYRMIADPKLLG